MALLRFAAHYYPDRCALVADDGRYTYHEIYVGAQSMTHELHTRYGIRQGQKVAVVSAANAQLVMLLPALSSLGANVMLINTDMTQTCINDILAEHRISLLLTEMEITRLGTQSVARVKPAVSWRTTSTISVFTGGSSGKYHEASRRTSVVQYLPPLVAMLRQIHIDRYDSVYNPLPLYHGFGLSTLIVAMLMGKKVCITRHFDATEALKTIHDEHIEVLAIVPAMLSRMWQQQGAHDMMQTVRCIISGGDKLDRKLADTTRSYLGNVMFNLYGTSEAGFFMIATPHDIYDYDDVPIGRPIKGVKCRVCKADSEQVGTLHVRSGWAMTIARNRWLNTGDLVSCNSEGLYFHHGRADRMVVCGGENVSPEHVEQVISEHPCVMAAVAYSVPHPLFGCVLHADVELIPHSTLTVDELKAWSRQRLARAEMPHAIHFKAIETLTTGKRRLPTERPEQL